MWTPRYNARFAVPILDQLIAVIQRDQQTAIANVDSALEPITEFHKGPGPRLQFPSLILVLDSTKFVAEDWDVRHSISSVTLHLDVGDFNEEQIVLAAQKYALVLDQIISTSAYRDFTDFTTALAYTDTFEQAGTTAPTPAGTVKELFIESHLYSAVMPPDRDVPLMRVTLTLQVEMEET